ncbi:MAG: arginine--tRNA ligase [Chlamydiota bacterium]|nr:arginine--tRNA ligase [Chlamydiota bacterium]
MKTPIKQLDSLFLQATLKAFPELKEQNNFSIELTQSTQEKFGHYQLNSAMRLTKLLKLPPRKIAEKIIEHLPNDAPIGKTEIAGPGFINITLTDEYITDGVRSMGQDPHLSIDLPSHPQKVVIDFSSPNIAKELHVGHLRSTIIGDSLARLYEFLGHDVLRLNHIGDWGTSFGMLIAYLKEEEPEILTGKKETDLSSLVNWYKAAKQKFDEDPAFKKRSQKEVSTLQGGDKEALNAWRIICEISAKAYREIYAILDVKITDRGESFYNPMLPEVIKDLEQKDLITVSNNAKCIFLDGFQNREGDPLPMIIQKSDGGYNYATTDMAAMKHRTQKEKADRIVILTDAGQKMHFEMLVQAAEKVGYLDKKKVHFDHITFGLVLGPDGKKFKTRSGETEKLIDLLTTAIQKADEILCERSPDMDETERKTLAKALGIGAVKYADLSCHRTGDYTFSYDRMLRFEGNTAAYLMYSYVRIAGIKRKANADIKKIKNKATIELKHPSEIELGLHLMRFGESLNLVAEDLTPNRLTDYLYGLAEKFNAFFRDCRVEGSPEQDSRLLLCEVVARTMKQGLDILGVQTVDRM